MDCIKLRLYGVLPRYKGSRLLKIQGLIEIINNFGFKEHIFRLRHIFLLVIGAAWVQQCLKGLPRVEVEEI